MTDVKQLVPEFLRVKDVMALTGLKRSTLYKMAAEGSFVRPIKLGDRMSAWHRPAVEDWIQAKLAAANRAAQP